MKKQGNLQYLLSLSISVLLALVLGGVIMALSGFDPIEGYTLMFNGAFGTQRAMLRMIGKRRQLLEYLKAVDIERYRAIVKKLNLRK